MKINVYVDAFNLYYGCIRKTPFHWLNIAKLCQLMLPRDQINQIKYFTALISARPHDTDQPIRQQTYLRALRTIPNMEIIYGTFLTHTRWMLLSNPTPSQSYAQVIQTTEKGSDVNLATHFLNDAFNDDYELGVIISNDSDLVEPIRIVSDEFDKPVGLLNPHKRPSVELRKHVRFIKQIRKGVLASSQFPQTLTDKEGTFHKPGSW